MAAVSVKRSIPARQIGNPKSCKRRNLVNRGRRGNRKDEIRECIQLTIARIDNFLETLKTPTISVDAPKVETPVSPFYVVASDFVPSNDPVESPVSLPVSAGNVEPSNNLVESPNPALSLSLPNSPSS